MRDSVLPFPLSSQLYNFGKPISSHDEHILSFHNVSGNNSSNSEVQVMPSLDISSFCWESIAFSDYQLVPPPPPPLAPAGARVNPHRQESLDVTCYDPAFEAAAWYGYSPFSVSDTTSLSESMMMSSNKVTSAGEIENGSHSKRGKKRVIEVSSMATKSTASATTTVGKRKKSSTATASSAEETWHQQLNDQSITIQEFKLQVPVRRSQKLSDKITALQKLVSPYGKTDTASVLQEASLYIKLLQKQIQKLSNMTLSNRISVDDLANKSWKTTIEGSEGELLDLRNRGLCLVPTSLTKKFVDQQCLVMDPSPNQEEDIAGI